jgi:hypothetical protein
VTVVCLDLFSGIMYCIQIRDWKALHDNEMGSCTTTFAAGDDLIHSLFMLTDILPLHA